MTPTPPPAPAEEAVREAANLAAESVLQRAYGYWEGGSAGSADAIQYYERTAKNGAAMRSLHKEFSDLILTALRPPAHGEHQGKRETTGTQAINYLLSENACGLPDNTCELLTALHDEFYGKGPAHADAFRILPKVVAFIEKHGLAQCPAEFNRDAIQDTFDETHMWTLHQEGGTGPDRSPGELAQAWAYDYIMQCEKRIAAQSARLAEVERDVRELSSEQGRVHDVLLTVDEIPHVDASGVRGIDEQVKDLAGLYRQLQKNCLQAFDLKVESDARALAAEQKVKEATEQLAGALDREGCQMAKNAYLRAQLSAAEKVIEDAKTLLGDRWSAIEALTGVMLDSARNPETKGGI
jgi:hypothetical protein